MPLDIVTAMPIDLLVQASIENSEAATASVTGGDSSETGGASSALQLIRMLRLLKLGRIVRVSRLVKRWQAFWGIDFTCASLVD